MGGNMGYFKTLIAMACFGCATCVSFMFVVAGSGERRTCRTRARNCTRVRTRSRVDDDLGVLAVCAGGPGGSVKRYGNAYAGSRSPHYG